MYTIQQSIATAPPAAAPWLRVSICKIARLGLIKDGKCGATAQRAERIKTALRWTAGNN